MRVSAPYHIALNLAGRRCLVVGGGKVATRKVAGLLDAGAEVMVVAPQASAEIASLADEGRVTWLRKHFTAPDVEGALLVFAATNDAVANDLVELAAHKAGILVNAASEALGGDFILPAVHREGVVSVAVDTGGAAPALSAHIRDLLGKAIDPDAASLAETLGKLKRGLGSERWRRLMDEGLAGMVAAGRFEAARGFAEHALAELENGGETGRGR